MQLNIQAGDRHLVFPKDAKHAGLARHTLTPTSTLVDVLAISNMNVKCKVVQVLSRLEMLQVRIAETKSLNDEEDRVVDVEEANILRMEPAKARLAPCLAELALMSNDFASFLASIPRQEMTTEEFKEYSPLNLHAR